MGQVGCAIFLSPTRDGSEGSHVGEIRAILLGTREVKLTDVYAVGDRQDLYVLEDFACLLAQMLS